MNGKIGAPRRSVLGTINKTVLVRPLARSATMSGSSRTLLSYLHRLATPTLADATLLARWRDQRDQDAFALLMARHGPMVLGVCRRILGDVQDAEDVFQATFLVLARKAAKLHRPEALASFLYGVAVRLAHKARAAAKRRKMVQPSAEVPEPVDPRPQPLDVLTGRELLALFDAEIARLPETYRLPLLLCLLQGRTVEEAAQQLGCSIGSLRGRLERGREQLRRRLSRRGLGLSVGAVALLAPAVVPEKLLAESLRHLSGPVPAAVSALAGGTMPAVNLKILGLALALVTAVGLGAGLSLRSTPSPQTPVASVPAAPQTQGKAEPRRDLHGDPLPEGALVRLGTVRFRHPGGCNAVALSPDGKVLATEGSGTVRLWDPTTGEPGSVLRVPRSNFSVAQNVLAFSADCRRLFYRRADGVVARNLKSGQSEVVWPIGGDTVVHALHPSPDGRLFAVGTNEGVSVVELASGRLCWRTRNGPDAFRPRDDRLLWDSPYSLALFRPGVAEVAVNASDAPKLLRLLDAASGEERRRIVLGDRLVRLAFSPDGRKVAVTERDNAVRVYDTATGRRLHSWTVKLTNPFENYTSAVTFGADGSTLAAGATDHMVHLWELKAGRELAPLRGHSWYVSGLTASADGRWLYSVGWDGAIRRWDTSARRERPVTADSATGVVAHSPAAPVLAWEGDGGVLHVGDAYTGKVRRTLPGNPAGVSCLRFSQDGTVLAAGGNDLSVQLWEVATGKLLRQWTWPKGKDPHACVNGIAFTSDGKRLATASLRTHEVLFWDARSGDRIARAPHEMAAGVVFSPDGRTLASAGWDRAVRWWQVPDLRPVGTVVLPDQSGRRAGPLSDSRLEAIAGSPDGRLLATTNLGGGISVWDARNRKLLHSFQAVQGQCELAFSPDGQWLSTGGYDGALAVWEVRSGKQVLKLAGHPARVFCVAFGPDGRTLLSGADDRTGLVWDLRPRSATADNRGTAELWDALIGADAAGAYRALWQLADRPEQTVPFLKGKLTPAKPIDRKHFQQLLDALDSDQFAEREAASRELSRGPDGVESMLRHALDQSPSPEKRRRLQGLLDVLPVDGSAEDVRRIRAVVVLQWTDTLDARGLLEELARGDPGARLTRQAKASLIQLSKLHSSSP
jgi:RNA polymerase sigma factor (sigma-70 family)